MRALVAAALLAWAYGCVLPLPDTRSGRERNAHGSATAASMPPGHASDEASDEQLTLARSEGQAVSAALLYLEQREAVASAKVRAGDYQVAVAFTPTEPAASTTASATAATHLVVVIQDGYDGRIVPELAVRGELYDASGARVISQQLPFVWHPLLNHYGADLRLAPGAYRVRVWIEPPRLLRHDPINGDRYRTAVFVEVPRLQLDAGALANIRIDPARRALLASAQGVAFARALATMANGVAVDGALRRAGDYVVAVGVEYAEGYWRWVDGSLRYEVAVEESAEKNAHVEVVILDALSGRFMPGIRVRASLYRDGDHIGTSLEPLMWHPWLYHYGKNWRIPSSGPYAIEVSFDRPPYRGYGAACCALFARGQRVRFDRVDMRIGQK